MMMKSTALLLTLLFYYLHYCDAASGLSQYDPKPNSKSVVQVEKARFTVLTENMIRMEWGGINDAPTFAFINRNIPSVSFKTSTDGNWTVIETTALKLRYLTESSSSFNADNLQVSFELNGKTVTWTPELAANLSLNGNLMGTIRTLDGQNGPVELDCYQQKRTDLHCHLGIISRSGYVVIDDTNQPQMEVSDWWWLSNFSFPQPSQADCSAVVTDKRQLCGYLGISQFNCNGMGCCYDNSAPSNLQKCYYTDKSYRDLYFFGYGHDYKKALFEFTMVSGKIPIPPRYAFGVFFSRYWAYDDIGEMNIVREYEQRGIPLDVLVTDMDWHITFYSQARSGKKDQAGQQIGWTGFTWDSHLFPDPKGFLDWCKAKGLQNTLNLHPASGIQPWEDKYKEMATAMGIDPSTNHYVPFNPIDNKFVTNWFKIVLGAREEEGIDFWWLDWQQGEDWIKVPGVNPTFWLNHIFFTDPYHWKNNTVRPFLLHRWGGLGNHRYQVGFSGDVVPSWESLDFQVNFTFTASNVGFGYWSHDIGGHILPSPPELYTRWVQWGAFSPMFRTHCTKNANNDRRIWVYPPENYEIMREAMLLRASLVPYIYTHARMAYDTGLSLLRPMYYEFPESDNAYTYDKQYYFGESILVAPITVPVYNKTMMAGKKIWIPQGTYISWVSGEMVKGDREIEGNYTLSEIPVFVKAGSIIPMRTDDFDPIGSAQEIPTKLKFVLFIGDQQKSSDNQVVVEDDGNTTQYYVMNKKYVTTHISYEHNPSQSNLAITVQAVNTGVYIGQPEKRSYQICIPNFWPADNVTIGKGTALDYVPLRDTFDSYTTDSWTYDGSSLSLIINLVTERPVDQDLAIVISYTSYKTFDPYFFPGFAGMALRLQQAKELLDDQWGVDTVYQDLYPSLLTATETARRITYNPTSISDITKDFKDNLTAGLNEVSKLSGLKSDVLAQIKSMLKSEFQ